MPVAKLIPDNQAFWEGLLDKYPSGMAIFFEWFNQYKKHNYWSSYVVPEALFAELPVAIQLGVYIQFCCERSGAQWHIDDMYTHDWQKDIEAYIERLEVDTWSDTKAADYWYYKSIGKL